MTIRQYKKLYAICKDDNGKVIYAGDTVEVHLPIETSTPHQSKVYWNMLDGAFIKAHSAHKFLHDGNDSSRNLRDYLFQEPYPQYYVGKEEPVIEKGYCRKVKSFNK